MGIGTGSAIVFRMSASDEEEIQKIIEKQNLVVGSTKSALRLAKAMQRELERGAKRAAKSVNFVNRQGRMAAGALLFVSAGIQFLVPSGLVKGGKIFMPVLEIALGLVFLLRQKLFDSHHLWLRRITVGMTLLLSLANAFSIAYLVDLLITNNDLKATEMLMAAGSVWFTNVVAFALLYWEFDRGGPLARIVNGDANADFYFPQMDIKYNIEKISAKKRVTSIDWQPHYFDYLFLAITTSSAFSPTDTFPLTWRAKLLTGIQSTVSLVTIALVAARAVNILK